MSIPRLRPNLATMPRLFSAQTSRNRRPKAKLIRDRRGEQRIVRKYPPHQLRYYILWTVHDNKNIKRVFFHRISTTTRTVEYHCTRTARVGRNTLIGSTPLIEALYIIFTRNTIFVASFEIFGYLAERLTACACSLLVSAHGAHSIGRIYLCKGYSPILFVLLTTNPPIQPYILHEPFKPRPDPVKIEST